MKEYKVELNVIQQKSFNMCDIGPRISIKDKRSLLIDIMIFKK